MRNVSFDKFSVKVDTCFRDVLLSKKIDFHFKPFDL